MTTTTPPTRWAAPRRSPAPRRTSCAAWTRKKLITPFRSVGGHRRYSRYQLRLAARAREMVDQGTALEAACRIIILEDQLEEALQHNQNHERQRQTDAA
nr:hypothetical protein GCM10020092_032790 [Actinoplanes digitatis]